MTFGAVEPTLLAARPITFWQLACGLQSTPCIFYYGWRGAERGSDCLDGFLTVPAHDKLIIDQLLLLCYHYDPKVGRYGAIAMGAMRTAGAVTLLALGAFVIVSARGARKSKSRTPMSLRGAP